MEQFLSLFSYSFFVKAFLVGGLVAICCAMLGVVLVLKRYSMIGDGLSHVAFGALAIGYALQIAPLPFTIAVVVVAAFFLLQLNESSKVKADAAIAIISSSALAIGVITTSLSSGINNDLYQSLFGTILAISDQDVWISVILCIVILIVFFLFYHFLFLITIDETFAQAIGVPVQRYKVTISILTALTIVLGMRVMGAMLISSLIILPALSAMKLVHHFKEVVIVSVIISIICFIIGMVISFFYSLPTGATIVITNTTVFVLASIYAYFKK